MSSASLLDRLDGPPRKRMRKGTKSCAECRRRKIRCTYDLDSCGICNECRLRGSTCVDQESSRPEPYSAPNHQGEQTYSLRERVTHLEEVVRQLVKRLDDKETDRSETSSPPLGLPTKNVDQGSFCSHLGSGFARCGAIFCYQTSDISVPGSHTIRENPTPASTESPADPEIDTVEEQIGNPPILQLFDNDVVRREVDPLSGNDRLVGKNNMSPKAAAARASLLALFPPREDIIMLTEASCRWWITFQANFPEICEKCSQSLSTGNPPSEISMAPGDVGKVLICIAMTLELLPVSFDLTSLRSPLDPKRFSERCVAEISRLIIEDDDFAATLPGIECQLLLSKYLLNDGRPRKAWLVCRRAIQFSQLVGMHLSTAKPRQSGDTLFQRRLQTWCSLVTNDRFLSFILGLPYSVSDTFFEPQIALTTQEGGNLMQMLVMRIALVIGKLVDRNQVQESLSLSSTLRLDQDLEDIAKSIPAGWWSLSNTEDKEFQEQVMMMFIYNVVRALLHLPFMLKSLTDRRYHYCHLAALDSARTSLRLFKIVRADIKPYLCKLGDFFAFMMTMLLSINLFGYSEASPTHSREQDEHDWQLIGEITDLFRQASMERGGNVAAHSAEVLSNIRPLRNLELSPGDRGTCKITIPYFGTITVGPGKKLEELMDKCNAQAQASASTSSFGETPTQLYTPPLSDSKNSSLADSHPLGGANQPALGSQNPNPLVDRWIHMESMPTMPSLPLDFSLRGLDFNGPDNGVWPNLNLDLGLDQGWNVDWIDSNTAY
ncbi:hypothetical protein ASPZODRAFT_12955 [Penicilliopsis zonata CBS 506.65]|uniref:Zn(2)-C6 fungal-type domain-containing protein n=1 Tax=Penicilliopsis zonata CBS 506.65 TaxID=1073090 RepID=A0A1L9SRU4_9EURO|nr:hypothetical protein ASPZODRAFT_12955 [Penicilliopsis zonata CBS 506.65]OJJ49843.1 hypothetical protein ASPZODRAFT_12955 [Penicilliopsis zonata CBS 506.65]